MQAELNKYFPTDISNLILEKHYKSMFSQSIVKMKKESDDTRTHYYESSDSEEEEDTDDEDDDEDDRQARENCFIYHFIRCIFFERKQRIRLRQHEIRIKKEEERKNKRIEELMKEDLYDWMSPEQRKEAFRSAVNVGFFDP